MNPERRAVGLLALCAGLYGGVFMLDLVTPYGFAVAVLYAALVPIGLGIRHRQAVLLLALLGTGLTLLAGLPALSGRTPSETDFINRAVAVIAIWITACLAIGHRQGATALSESEQRFRRLIEGSAQGIIIHRAGRALFANRALCRLFGYASPEEVLALDSIDDYVAPHERERVRQYRTARWHGDEAPVGYEYEGVRTDGSQVWIDCWPIVVDWDGEPAIQSVMFDITERKQAVEALEAAHEELAHRARAQRKAMEMAERANREKSAFLARMSHELRTPLNAILGFSEVIKDQMLGPIGNARYGEYASDIHESGRLLKNLIDDLLDLAKIEAGKLELDPTDTDVSTLVDSVVELLSARAHAKDIELAAFVSPDVPAALKADASRLRQILINLVGNAIKFTEFGGVTVEVTCKAIGGGCCRLHFRVVDSGIGIADELQARLFDKFTQADGSTTRRFGGTGLGLAIAKQLVELMGGEIGIQSKEGEGSVFWFDIPFPLSKGADPAATSAGHFVEQVMAAVRGRRILVVDDNEINRQVFVSQLSALGMKVDSAWDAESALHFVRDAKRQGRCYEVAILDHMMPRLDGADVRDLITADTACAPAKLVLSTSSSLGGGKSETVTAGFDAVVPKPVHRGSILRALASIFEIAAPQPDADTAEAKPLVTDQKILLVEDNEVNQLLARTLLVKRGYEVTIANNGAEAIAALRTGAYDVVLMDIQMPVMDGLEATRRIRLLDEPLGNVPIIAMTANAMQGDHERCIQAGMSDYISKPINREELLAKLGYWTGQDSASLDGDVGGQPAAKSEKGPDAEGARALESLLSGLGDS